MLGVVDHFLPFGFQERHRLANQIQVFLQGDAQSHFHVQIPSLPEDGHHRSVGFQKRLQVPVVGDAVSRVASAAKGRQLGMLQLQFLGPAEESNVLAVRPGPAAFNVIHPQLVQLLHNVKLVFQ
jgi:hypothetical protein